jgi:hypothetical protein
LRDVIRARNRRRKELRSILHDRQKMVDTLLQLKQGPSLEKVHANTALPTRPAVHIKRYLCHGPPGIGMTVSALRYSRAEMIIQFDRWTSESRDQLPINTLLYTTSVINTPSRVESDIRLARERLMGIALRPLRREAAEVLDAIRLRDETKRREILNREGCSPCDRPPVDPT